MRLEGEVNGRRFFLVATHLQGEEGRIYTEGHQRVRDSQLAQIRDELVTPVRNSGIPIIVAGDFVIPRYKHGPGLTPSDAYVRMLSTLSAVNGPSYRVTLVDDRRVNDLAESNSGRTDELDYILTPAGEQDFVVERERIVFQRQGWDPKHYRRDLSYRYAVAATLYVRLPVLSD